MSCNLVSTINGNECIGDSREKINLNFTALESVVCSLSTNSIIANDTDTIDLTFTPSTRILVGGVKPDSLDSTHLKDNSVGTSELSAQAVTTAKIALSAITAEKMSGGQTGSAPVYGCRAWVNFDGTRDITGTISTSNTNRFIRAGGNVSSVERVQAGNYVIKFTQNMSDINYCVNITTGRNDGSGTHYGIDRYTSTAPLSTNAVRMYHWNNSSAWADAEFVCVSIFG